MKIARIAWLALVLALALGLGLGLSSCSSPSLKRETLQPRIAFLVSTPGETVRGETLLQREAVGAFYAARKSQPAWKLPSGGESVRQAIADIAQDGLDPGDYHLAKIDSLLEARKAGRSDELDVDLEILLTDAVAAMIDHARYGRVRPASLDKRWNVDSREGAPPLEQALARIAEAPSPAEGIAAEKLDHFIYKGLKAELARLEAVVAAGGWAPIPGGKAIRPGATDPRLPLVRARLAATGELPREAAAAADSGAYDDALQAAVKLFQERHRLEADGAIDAATLAAMNVSATDRVNQVRVNLERSRWVLPGLTGGDFLLVNLPAFKAYLIRGNQNVWETRTQIGKEARQTPSFRADMKHAIFNPTWTVPPTILKEDVLGGIARGENMLAKKNLKVYDRQGNQVDPSSIDWSAATSGGSFPYTLRQDAGADNALGRVKFMFPNPYDIYLHDTPSRELFAAETRTFSSGCIRIEDPLGLAQMLLGDKGYDQAKIEQVIATGKTTQVELSQPLPVLIVYWTTSVGASGEVRYGPDVYDRDPPVLAALAAEPRVAAATP
jgi:murein L,D-transpeptidase YcbB/YkuD